MKKKVLSLLLTLCLVMTFLPMAAFAAGPDKISITTVAELLQFANAVDNGEYDGKTDAVVSLDADLDLTGVAWKPIGSDFDGDGNLLHYFSGKFYGNGHTISNLDFSKNYGKTEYPSFGFFSEVYGAEISGLTIQGKLDVSNSGYVYFGTVAGVAADSKISDCVSDVSFTDTDKYINGTAALCGWAINSTIEHCQNKGIFSITTDTTSLQMGGIVGLAQNSTVQYCANTGNITSWTPCTGGIVGQLFQNSKIINCYSTGGMAPLGNGTTDFGGIAGIVGAGTEIRHCYFAGGMDLSQYTATKPYKRLGGIAGGVSSDTPVFGNNYFVETENVPACFKYQDAGTEKTLDFMKTEDFFNEITAAGGNYRFNPNGTPLLPAPKYTVSFVVTPAELANVVIKVNGQEVANPVDLEAGTYTVEVNADNCEVFNSNITITADTATHTQTIAMTYLPSDYTKFIEAIAAFVTKVETSPFSDVSTSAYYYEAVKWAQEKGITGGIGNGLFGPNQPCTRAQIVTFLWRAAGSPEPKAMSSFADVSTDAYYAKAVAWAVENGITTGTGDGKFSPDATCTRAQSVTFLFRAIGKLVDSKAEFSDVLTDSYYANAVAWAVENGVTNGIGDGLFGPDNSCTRAQIVTFLYRAYQGK